MMKETILRVAVPSPLYRYFDYLPPENTDPASLKPGTRLRIPFGRSQQIGILQEIRTDSAVPHASLRRVLEILDTEPVLPADIQSLLQWAQRYYHHPPGEVFATALPVLLRKGKAARRQSERLWLINKNGLEALAAGLTEHAPRQKAFLHYLRQHAEGVPAERLRKEFPTWSNTARALQHKAWIETRETPVLPALQGEPVELNSAQQKAVDAVRGQINQFQVFLLDGVTGSGKTEVYLRIVQAVLESGRQALILVPEIGLTPQLLARFQRRIGHPLAVLHSALSDRERLNAWLSARDNHARVIIGTRSAIFTPLARPGVIIIDEEHDTSLKQQEGFRYHSRDLAIIRAREAKIPIVLGSATPSLESLHNTRRRRYHNLSLPERVGDAVAPQLQLLDIRSQNMSEGLSAPLLRAMQTHLEAGSQVLLFLNRRGFAPTLICHECGWLSHCRHCDAHMTLHLRRQRLICHHCGAEQAIPQGCAACGSVDLRALGQGTERIERALKKAFPDIGIARIDRDSTQRKGSLQNLLEDIHAGRRRILIGTQMLAKGHHFPEVTLVGIVNADQGLFGVDYRAAEHMAQLVLQVAGRAGRAEKPGTVIIQTHHPEHPLLQTLVNHGYAAFADSTLLEREAACLPPFTCQALLRADAREPEPAHLFLHEALALSADIAGQIELLGPIPAPMERRAGRYRAQLLVQSEHRATLHRFLQFWILRLSGLKTGRKVRWSLDVDPLDLL